MKIGDKIKCIEYIDRCYTVGKIYTVIELDRDGDPRMIDDYGADNCYYASYFEVVSLKTFEYALGLIGKLVSFDGKPFKVRSVTVFNKYYPAPTPLIEQEVNLQGYCIVFENDDGYVPLSSVEEINNKITLTKDYDAIIEGDIVKVGCQDIPIEKVKEILDTYNKIKG